MQKQKHSFLLTGKLEKTTSDLFIEDRYRSIRKEEFENKHGVYALYKKKR